MKIEVIKTLLPARPDACIGNVFMNPITLFVSNFTSTEEEY